MSIFHDENQGVTPPKMLCKHSEAGENSLPDPLWFADGKNDKFKRRREYSADVSTWMRAAQNDVTISCCPIATVFCFTIPKCCESRASTKMRMKYTFINKDTLTFSQKSKFFLTFVCRHRSLSICFCTNYSSRFKISSQYIKIAHLTLEHRIST